MNPLTYRAAGVDIDAGEDAVRRIASLARRTFRIDDPFPGAGRTVADELLEPTRIYVKPVLELLARLDVHAMAHITGGGLIGNLPRVLPEGCRAVIRRGTWRIPPVFEALRDAGKVADAEMFRTFNMGIGYVLVVPPKHADEIQVLPSLGRRERVFRLGEVVAGARGVEVVP